MNVTPEAMGNDPSMKRMMDSCGDRWIIVTKDDLCHAYHALNGGRDDIDIDHNDEEEEIHLVALGNPHLSVTE